MNTQGSANSTPVQAAPRAPSQQAIISTLMRELAQINDNRYYLQALVSEQEVEIGIQGDRILELERELSRLNIEDSRPKDPSSSTSG